MSKLQKHIDNIRAIEGDWEEFNKKFCPDEDHGWFTLDDIRMFKKHMLGIANRHNLPIPSESEFGGGRLLQSPTIEDGRQPFLTNIGIRHRPLKPEYIIDFPGGTHDYQEELWPGFNFPDLPQLSKWDRFKMWVRGIWNKIRGKKLDTSAPVGQAGINPQHDTDVSPWGRRL